jgi:hypothetical protein
LDSIHSPGGNLNHGHDLFHPIQAEITRNSIDKNPKKNYFGQQCPAARQPKLVVIHLIREFRVVQDENRHHLRHYTIGSAFSKLLNHHFGVVELHPVQNARRREQLNLDIYHPPRREANAQIENAQLVFLVQPLSMGVEKRDGLEFVLR